MTRRILLPLLMGLIATSMSMGQTVGLMDFDGTMTGVISGFTPADNLDDGGGDFFGIGDLANWPQGLPTPGIPFSIGDDSVIDISEGTRDPANAFPGDNEGVFGQERDPEDGFFAISDTRDAAGNLGAPPTAEWVFDVSGYTDLALSIDMGAQANDSFGGFSDATLVTFEYSIDGSAFATAFSIAPNSDFGTFGYRAMDSGLVPPVGDNGPLQATGPNAITKFGADGSFPADTFLNKSPADGTGAGELDSFLTEIVGTGDELTLRLTADLPFEAMVFDNIEITGNLVPEPASATLLGLALLSLAGLRRRASR